MENRYIVNTKNTVYFLSKEEIIYCKSENSYSTICIKDKKLLVSKSLSQVEREISHPGFIRISQSYIVNSKMIDHIDKQRKMVYLTNKESLPFTVNIQKLLEYAA